MLAPLDAEGREVLVGDRFAHASAPERAYVVRDVCSLFVYLYPDGWVGPPRTPKRRKFAGKDWIRCPSTARPA